MNLTLLRKTLSLHNCIKLKYFELYQPYRKLSIDELVG